MMLGKRARPPIKRTTSITEFTLDLTHTGIVDNSHTSSTNRTTPTEGLNHRFLATTGSSRNHHRNSTDHMETTHFLRACHLCDSRFIPGRDIYMYRGDGAFCSLECRRLQMNQDDKKEKSSLAQLSSSTSKTA